MFIDLERHLKELRETAALTLPRVEKILAVRRNLRAFKDHLGVVRYCSSDVNAFVNSIEMTHRTDGDGSALEILPFRVEEGIHLYSDPPIYVVGYRNPHGFGEVALPDWRDMLEDNNISNAVIRKVKTYFRGHVAVNYNQTEEIPKPEKNEESGR